MPACLAHRFALPFLFLSLLLVGCASSQPRLGYGGKNAPPIQEQLSGKETVVYLVPKSPDIVFGEQWEVPLWREGKFHNALRGVGFLAFDNTDTRRNKITRCPAYDVASNTLVCEKIRIVSPGITNQFDFFSVVAYRMELVTTEKPDRYELTLTPKLRETRNHQDLLMTVEAPPFPEAELLDFLYAGRIRFKLEVDSQFEKSSISANFARLLGQGQNPRPGEAAKYRMKRDGWNALLIVEMWPYRGGTKVGVKAVVDARTTPQGAGASRTVDFVKIMDEVRKEIEKVVGS